MQHSSRLAFSAALAVGALIGITAASAADIAPRTYTKAPVYIEPAFNWSGFYLGANIGYGWGNSRNTETLTNATTGVLVGTNRARDDVNGVIGGAQAGYNWQYTNWLVGLETDIQGSGQRGSASVVCLACANDGTNITATLSQKLEWFGTVRGRVGILATPNVLFYGTGGLAYGDVRTSGSVTGNSGLGTPITVALGGTSLTRVGWTAGAGVEGRVSGNWTVKFEYLYMDLGNVSNGPGVLTGILVPVRTNGAASYTSHFTDNIVRVGFNYLFSPGLSKY